MDQFPTGVSETLPSIPHEKDKFLPIRLEGAQIWTTSTGYSACEFFLKSFIGSQHAISPEIYFKFSEAQPRAKKLQVRRFEYSLKRA
jgi:hypothetical protein